MSAAVLAIDQGSHSTRACLIDARGQQLAAARLPIATRHPANDQVEHEPAQVAASVHQAVAQCLDAAPRGTTVRAAGLATQRSSFVCVERESLRPLSPVISWQDRRHARWLATLVAHEPRVRALTGLPLSPHYGASKMRWCLEQLPSVQAAARAGTLCFAPLSSFLTSTLTGGKLVADPANASRTLLWDSARLAWSDELLAWFGIRRDQLPRCAATSDDFGTVRAGAHAVSLRAVSGDQSAVPFAFGHVDEQRVFLNLGTGAFLQRPLAKRPADPAPLLGSVLMHAGARTLWSLEGTVNGAASAVSWFAEREGCEVAALWSALPAVPPEAPVPLFVNGIGGLGSPWWHADVESTFIGDGTRGERFAAVVESILFLIADNLDCMRRHGDATRELLVTGGISRSDWFCSRLAALTGCAVRRGPAEATALGIAALADPELASGWTFAADTPFLPSRMPALAGRRERFSAALARALRPR